MFKLILESGNIFIDESPVDMLLKGNGKVHQAFMWVISGGKAQDPPYRAYHFKLNRQHKNAVDLLQNYSGVLHSDKYGAYVVLAQKKKIIWCPCWSHIRRKFVEAEFGDSKFREIVLRKIRHLFMLDKVAWSRSAEERLKIRQEKSAPIIDELIAMVENRLIKGGILPKSKFKTALGYFCSLIPYLKNYTKYPFARLDNNVAERAIRPLAIGRKNWLFMGSQEGGDAAAVILSLVQTCRGLGINPRDYLEDVMKKMMGHPFNKLQELLPDQWAKKNKIVDTY
jgi:transposase